MGQHHFLLDKDNHLSSNNRTNSNNISFNSSNNNNNFNPLLILINILLIKVQLLELPQRGLKTKTSVSFHDDIIDYKCLYLQIVATKTNQPFDNKNKLSNSLKKTMM